MNSITQVAPPTADTRDTALRIAYYLAREAVWDQNRCNWIGNTLESVSGNFQVVRKSFATDFYNGTSGIAFFLATLLQFHEDPIVEQTLEGCMNQVLSFDETNDRMGSNFGFYGGRMGIVFAIVETGRLRQRHEWIKAGFDLLDRLCQADIQDHEIDVIAGVAGGIPLLLKYFRETENQRYRDTAVRCGNFLLDQATKSETSWEWRTPIATTGLTGYSHGNAGMALALLELYAVTQDPRYYTAAMYGFNYERLKFNPAVQNWPDFRVMPGAQANANPGHGESWCHGAPGIALSRLRAWELTGDNSFLQEAEIALDTTYKGVYQMLTQHTEHANFSLCHGLAGNADILLHAGQKLNRPQFQHVSRQAAELGMEKYDRTGLSWPSGVNDPSGSTRGMAETPGFMLGLAGTGYFYLRNAMPERVRSLLIL